MIELELAGIMSQIVEDYVEVGPEHEVAVITDAERHHLGTTLTSACRATGSDAVLLTMPKTENQNAEPPGIVSSSLAVADIAFNITSHPLTHTNAFRAATEECDTLFIAMSQLTTDMFLEGAITADFEAVDSLSKRLKLALNDTESVRVTSPSGTDVTFCITDRPAFVLGYEYHDFNDIGSFPASGETPVSPRPGSAKGTIVIDHSMANIGFIETPIELTYEDGELVDIDGGLEATTLEDIIVEADENAGNLAEFAIGTNPAARLSATVAEAKKTLGTCHFAIGDNASLGGSINSDIHLDGIVLDTSIYLDGEQIMEDGKLLEQYR